MHHVFGRRLLIGTAALALLCAGACSGKNHDASSSTTSTSAGIVANRIVDGKARVTGQLMTMNASAADLDPIPTPFTITMPNPGGGRLDLPQAIVDGTQNTIIWTGGRPLPVTGTCQLDAGEAQVNIDAGGVHVLLDGAVRALTAGACNFGSSVAVGVHGLASPVPSVAFTLPASSDFTSTGGATANAPAPGRYESANGTLSLGGTLHVETETDEFKASSVNLQTGTWVVTLTKTATAGVYNVVANLEGHLLVDAK